MATITIPITDHNTEGVCTQFYTVRYKFDGASEWQFNGSFLTSPIVINNLATDTLYNFEVTRTCCDGSSSTPATFDVDTTEIVAPTSFNVVQDGVDVDGTWTNMGVDDYEWQRATDSGFTTGLTAVFSTGGTNSFTDLAPGAGTFWYRVRSVVDGVAGLWATDSVTLV